MPYVELLLSLYTCIEYTLMNRITWIETIEKKARLETVDGYIGYVPKNGSKTKSITCYSS